MLNWNEFKGILGRPNCFDFWVQMSKQEVNALAGQEIAAMVGFDQRNPHHCYDLFRHTLHTLDYVRQHGAAPALLAAAFLHDIGKPQSAREKDGRLVFYGHAKKSAEIAAPLLEEMGCPCEEMDKILFWIRHHDDFISYVLPEEDYDRRNPYLVEITQETVTAHINAVQEKVQADWEWPGIWRDLLLLCQADAAAQSEFVYRESRLVDSRAHKIQKMQRIKKFI